MSITRLPEIVFPLTQVNKVNEIVDVLNDNLNMYYSEENPALTPVEGIATWTVTHNLGTENVNCSLYNGDMLVLSSVSVTCENVVTVSLNSDTNIPADTYKIVIISNGAGSSSGSDSYVLPTASTTTLGAVRIDGSSIKINNGVICTGAVKIYTVGGECVSSNGDTVKGRGAFCVKLYPSGLAEIQHVYRYTATGTSSSNFACGMSANLIRSLNSNIPVITPLSGGTCTIYSSGSISPTTEYGGWYTGYEGFWVLSRVTETSSGGALPANACKKDNYVIGTAYGTYIP